MNRADASNQGRLTFPRLVAALTLLAIFAMAARVSIDTDTWWHLRTGQWILEHGRVPVTDPFSFTQAGQPWQYPSAGWLAEVPLFWLFERFGYLGLNLYTAVLAAAALGFVYRASSGPPLLRAFSLVLAAAASAIFWSARPQMVSFLLAGVFAWVLSEYRWRGVNRLWLLPPLMLVWANAHGGFAIGFILLGLTFAGQAVSWIGRRLSPSEGAGDVDLRGLAWLSGMGLACAAAVMVNPSGPAMLLYPFKTLSIGVLRDFIQEWQSPNFHMKEAQPFLWLLLATLGAAGLAGRRMNFTDLVLVSGVGYLGFLAGRNIALLAVVAPPVLTRAAARGWAEVRARFPARAAESPTRITTLLNWTLLALAVAAAGVKVFVTAQPALNEPVVTASEPVAAAAFLRQAGPAGPLFNSYNWGGYLVWALPEYPVYIDGRTDLYPDAFLRDYLNTAAGGRGWQAALDARGVNLILVESGSPLAEAAHGAGWRELYADAQAVVLERPAP